VIVRIATEDQYRLPDEQAGRLDELDDAVVRAVESGDRERFEQRFVRLLDFVRAGELIDDAHLEGSDVILPPPDLSLEEAAGEFSGEGLIPD
jgi:hypothetical protein